MRMLLAATVLAAAACGGAPSTTKPTAPSTGDDTTIALVYSGWEIWIGNDDVVAEDDSSRYPGALKGLQAAVAKADFAHAAPAGSQGLIVTYAAKADLRVPVGPIANLTPQALGTQKDYYSAAGVELVAGVTLAITELEKTKTHKKQLILVSDGNDTNNEAAKPALAQLKARAASAGIELTSIVYKGALSGDANVTTSLTTRSSTINSADLLGDALVQAIHH